MKAVVQRVRWAEVEVDGRVVGRIEIGLLIYAGVAVGDTAREAWKLGDKVASLRIFEDEAGKLSRSVQEIGGGVLAISNFTLLADARHGRRPAFLAVAPQEKAAPIFDGFVSALRAAGITVAQGVFGATMHVRSEAAGPVNILLEVGPPSAGAESAAGFGNPVPDAKAPSDGETTRSDPQQPCA
jgi:D-aminoacyl-tRNA deacylase